MIVNVINTSNNNLPKYETSLSAGMDVRADFSKIIDLPIREKVGRAKYVPEQELAEIDRLMDEMKTAMAALIPVGEVAYA